MKKKTNLSLNWYKRIGDKENVAFKPAKLKEGVKPKPYVFQLFGPLCVPEDAQPVHLCN